MFLARQYPDTKIISKSLARQLNRSEQLIANSRYSRPGCCTLWAVGNANCPIHATVHALHEALKYCVEQIAILRSAFRNATQFHAYAFLAG